MRTLPKILFISFTAMIFSCNREETPDDHFHAADNFNRTIKINAYHVYDVPNALDSALSDVTVEVYSNRDNFVDAFAPDATRITDSAGYAVFEGRDKDFYWIRAQHDAFGIIVDSAGTPPNTISFIQLLFY